MLITSKTIRIISISTIIILLITMLKVTWESLLSRGRTKTPRPKGLRLFLEQVAFSYFAISILWFHLIIFVFLFVVRHRFANGKFFNRSKNKRHLAKSPARQIDTKMLIFLWCNDFVGSIKRMSRFKDFHCSPNVQIQIELDCCLSQMWDVCMCALEIFRNLDWNVGLVYLHRHEMCAL